MQYDIIHIAGKPHVLVPLHDFTQMKNGTENESLPADILEKLTLAKESPIKTIRKYRGLTQYQLADACELSRPYLTEIENGRKEGSIATLKKIAKVLDAPLEKLA